MKYVVARTFPIAGGEMKYGEEVGEDVVGSWTNLQSLIASHYLYPVADDDEAPFLPPHLYSQVANIQITRGIIEFGEAPDLSANWSKPPGVERQEKLLDMEQESVDQNKALAELRARRAFDNFQVTQTSPRPIELPEEKVFLDSKHDEALGSGTEHIVVPEGDIDLPEPAEVEEQELSEIDDDDQIDTPRTGYKPEQPDNESERIHPIEVEHGADFPDEDDENNYTKADLIELAKSWNDDHSDDKVSTSQNKADLEADLKERGAL